MPARKKQTKKKSGATRKTPQKPSGIKFILIFGITALFATFLWYLDRVPVHSDKQLTKNNQEKSKKSPEKNQSNKKEKYNFVFYTELPEREVETYAIEEEPKLPVKRPAAPKKSAVAKPATVKPIAEKSIAPKAQIVSKESIKPKKYTIEKKYTRSNMLYQLQVGACSEWSKADAMKGRLALLGGGPNIQMFSLNGRKMYRVRIGPSTDAKKIERIKVQLKAQNISTFVQKIKS